MSARQSPCFTCLKGVAKLIKFRQNGHIPMQFFSFWGDRNGVLGLTARDGTGRNGKRKASLRRISIQTCTTRRLFPTGMSGCSLLTFPFYFFTSLLFYLSKSSILVVGFRHLVQRLGYPHAVTAVFVPIVSCRGEVAELHPSHCLVVVAFEVGAQNCRHFHCDPSE